MVAYDVVVKSTGSSLTAAEYNQIREMFIDATRTADRLNISSASNVTAFNVADITSTASANTLISINCTNANRNASILYLYSTSPGIAFDVRTSTGSNNWAANISDDSGGVGTNYVVLCNGATNNRSTAQFYRNVTAAVNQSSVVSIQNGNIADDQACLLISQYASTQAISIEQNTTSTPAIGFYGTGLTTPIFICSANYTDTSKTGNSAYIPNNKGTFTQVGYLRINVGGTPYLVPYGTAV